MPIYEYNCPNCGTVEAIQKFGDDDIKACPSCGAENPKKVISASSFQLKGSGWYQTDYKTSGAKSDDSSNSKKKPEAKTETATPCSSSCKCH